MWRGEHPLWALDPKIWFALATLAFYVFVLVRAQRGAAPVSTARLSIAGFVLVLLSYTAVNLLVSKLHDFTLMNLLFVGWDHRAAPLDLRERLAFTPEKAREALDGLFEEHILSEGAIVSTCNRAEIYGMSDREDGLDALAGFFSRFHRVDDALLRRTALSGHGDATVRHLFRVAAGLDSMVLGEAQILGQIREAHRLATAAGTVRAVTNRLFMSALECGKRVRAETALGQKPTSVAGLALLLAGRIFESLKDRRVLLIGAGETAELTARLLADDGVSEILVANRSHENGEALAAAIHGRAVRWEDRARAAASVDLVLSATNATEPVLTAGALRTALHGAPRRGPLLVLDLAVPRDVEPEVGDLSDVYRYDLDSLRGNGGRERAGALGRGAARRGDRRGVRPAIPGVVGRAPAGRRRARPEGKAREHPARRAREARRQARRAGPVREGRGRAPHGDPRRPHPPRPDGRPEGRRRLRSPRARRGRARPFPPRREAEMTTATAARPLRMGTRASALARTQSGAFAAELSRLSGRPVETIVIRTHGDQLSSEGKAPPGGDAAGVFVRALDEALLRNEIDFAVHSLKDVPTAVAPGVVLAAVPERADPRDAFVVASRHPGVTTVGALPPGARVATSSPRRVSQLLRIRPDLVTVAMAGNVDTRLQRLEEGRADALILACAGLDRLGRGGVITRRLEPDEMLGAPAQGALGGQLPGGRRRDDRALLSAMDHQPTRVAAEAERELLQFLRGGCRAPVGARGFLEGEEGNRTLKLVGRVLSLDGRECLEDELSEPFAPPPPLPLLRNLSLPLLPSLLLPLQAIFSSSSSSLGRALAERLLARGAARLIDAARERAPG